MTFSHIRVDRSVVGTTNTGNIQRLGVALTHIQNGRQAEVADALQKLTQAAVDTSDLQAEQKGEALEHLAYLATQAELPQPQRQPSVGRLVITGLERLVNLSASLMTL